MVNLLVVFISLITLYPQINKYGYTTRRIIMEFILGGLVVLGVAIFLPVKFATFVAFVRSFWDKPPSGE